MIENGDQIRLAIFIGSFTLIALVEAIWPRRQRLFSRRIRWSTNLALTFFNSFLLRISFPFLAVGWAEMVVDNGWGVFQWIALPESGHRRKLCHFIRFNYLFSARGLSFYFSALEITPSSSCGS